MLSTVQKTEEADRYAEKQTDADLLQFLASLLVMVVNESFGFISMVIIRQKGNGKESVNAANS